MHTGLKLLGAPTFIRMGVSLAVMAFLLSWLDASHLLRQLAGMHPGWVAVALLVTVAQMFILAWRWHFTAARLGLPLQFTQALRGYYQGTFLNQVLPGGVLGDVSRAWEHGRAEGVQGGALQGVVLERLSAQVVMTGLAVGCLVALPWTFGEMAPWLSSATRSVILLAVLGGAALVATLLWLRIRTGEPPTALASRSAPAPASLRRRVVRETIHTVLAPEALPFQLGSAILVVGGYVAVFVIAGQAVAAATSPGHLALLAAPVLMAMLIPITVAGWGLREGAAAALWAAVGLPPEEGVLVSMTYGVLVLVGSLPGALTLLFPRSRSPGRTGCPLPGETSERGAGAPHPASEWDPD